MMTRNDPMPPLHAHPVEQLNNMDKGCQHLRVLRPHYRSPTSASLSVVVPQHSSSASLTQSLTAIVLFVAVLLLTPPAPTYYFVAAQVTIPCNVATTIADPGVATTYQLTGCTASPGTTITLAASSAMRTISIVASGSTPCYVQMVNALGAQSNLNFDLKGVTMNCVSSHCFSMAGGTMTSVTIAATSYISGGITVMNTFSASGSSLVNVASATTLFLQFDSSTISTSGSTFAIGGALSGLTMKMTSTSVNAGGNSILNAASTASNIGINFNDLNSAASTSVTSSGFMFSFASTVLPPFSFYSGPSTTFIGLSSGSRLLSFQTLVDVSTVGVTLSSTSITFPAGTTMLYTAGSFVALTLSIYGSSQITAVGSLIVTGNDLRASTISMTATGLSAGTFVNVGGAISTVSASFVGASGQTITGALMIGTAITGLTASCVSIATSSEFLEITGNTLSTGVALSASACSSTGNYFTTGSTSTLTGSSITLTSSNMINSAKTSFDFGGPVSTTTISLISTLVNANKYIAFKNGATQVTVVHSAGLISTATSVFSFESTSVTSSSVGISVASTSTFYGPTFMAIGFNLQSTLINLDSGSRITATSTVITSSSTAIVNSLSIIGGVSSTITSGGTAFQLSTATTIGLALTGAGAIFQHLSSNPLMTISSIGPASSSDFSISVGSSALISSPGSILFSVAGNQAFLFRLSVVGGVITVGQFVSISTASAITSNFIITATSNAVLMFSSTIFSAIGVGVTSASIALDSGTTISATNGLYSFPSTSVSHSGITFTAVSLNAASLLSTSTTTTLITMASIVTTFSVSLNGALTVSTTSAMFALGGGISLGSITFLNSVTLISPSAIISTTGMTQTTLSVASSTAMSSTGSHLITIGAVANTFSIIASASTFEAALRIVDFSSTASSIVISMAGCTFTSSGTTLGAIQVTGAASSVQVTFMSASTISVPNAALLYFSGTLDGTNIFSMSGASTITVPTAPMITCVSGFQGTSLSLLISSVTITAANRLLGADMTSSTPASLGSVISIVSSTITIRTTLTSLDPTLIAINNAATMNGVVWTVSSCGITHLIPIVPGNDIFLSLFAVVGSRISITNSIGPSYQVYATSVTSMSSYLSTFIGLRFDATGLSQGSSNPQGTIIMEQLTYSVSTKKVGLVYSGSDFVLRFMNMTFQCIDIPTTSISPVWLNGLVDQVYFNLYGVQIHQTQAQVAAIDASHNSGNQYLKFTFLNSLIHTPLLIGIYPSQLVANPTPPQVAEIYAGCSHPSVGYAMSAWSFGSPLYTAFQAISCQTNKYKNCLATYSRSSSTSITPSFTREDSLSKTPSTTDSLSDEPTKTWVRTFTNYSISNSSEQTMSKSMSNVRSRSNTASKDFSESRSTTVSSSLTLSGTTTMTDSQTPSFTKERTPSETVTGTVTDSRGSRTRTESVTPTYSMSRSVSQTPTESVSSSSSTSQEYSPSHSSSEELTVSRSVTASPSYTTTSTDEKSRSRTNSLSETPSGVTPSAEPTASPSDSESKELTVSPSSTNLQSSSESITPSLTTSGSFSLSKSGTRSRGTRSPTVSKSVTLSVATFTNDESRSTSVSMTSSITVTPSSSMSVSPSLTKQSPSEEPTASRTPTPSDSASASTEISESRSGSQSSSFSISESITLSFTTEASLSTSESLSGTISMSPTTEASRSFSPSNEKTHSPMSVTITPTISTTEVITRSPSLSETVTLTDTWTDEKSLTATNTISKSRSDMTSDMTLTATATVSPTYSVKTVTSDHSYSWSKSDSLSPEQPSGTRTLTATMSSSGTQTITQTESVTFGSLSADQTYTGLTRNITPTRQTFTLSESESKNSHSQNITESHTKPTPTITYGSQTEELSISQSNSSSPSQERTRKTESKSPNSPTRTITSSESSDVTLTVTRTITPPRTLTDTRSITPGKPGPLSNLQAAVNFFNDFLANGQSCTAAIWYVIGIMLLLFLLEAFVILVFKILGGIYEKHPETEEGVGVMRSLIVRSTYLGVFWPCHYRCALPHTAIAILHITLVMAIFYVAATRLYLSSTSPTSLRVIVALGSAVAPHIITNPLRQLLFYYTFNTNKLEKAWLKYCEITGRHQSREYYPTVKATDELQVVLDMSKSKVDPQDANVSHHRQRHAKESAWRKKVDEDDTFEFDMAMPGAAAITAKKKPGGARSGAVAVQIMDVVEPKKKGKTKNKIDRDASEAFGDSINEAPIESQQTDQPIIRVMSVRRLPGALSPVSPSFKKPSGMSDEDDEEDELPQITVVTDTHTPKKKKKKGKKKNKQKKDDIGTPLSQQNAKKNAPSPISLLGVGEFVDSDSDISIDVDAASPTPKKATKKKTKATAGSKKTKGGNNKYSSEDEDFTIGSTKGSQGRGGGGGGGDGVSSEIGSIDINAIFGSALFGGSTTTGGSKSSQGGVGGKANPEDLSGYVPSIVISVPAEHAGSFIDTHNLDLDFSDLGPDDDLLMYEDQRPNTKGGLGVAQRDVLAAFATPRGAPSISSTSDGRITAAIFDDVDSLEDDEQEVRAPDFPSSTRNTPVPNKGAKKGKGAVPQPKEGSTAFKLLHGIEDPFQVTDSEESSDDEATKKFKKASAPSDLFNENDPFGFANSVRPATSDSASGGVGGRRGSQSFKLHPLKDSTVAVIDGGINNKVVQHNLEDRWERRSDEWSLPSASDSTDTDGDDEEGREYFPAPIIVYNLHVVGLTALIFAGVCFALFFSIRGIQQPEQLCITDLLYVTFLVDFFAVEFVCAMLILLYRIWWFNEDGSHERRSERNSWRTAIRQCNCTMHPFIGELKQHMIPPLRKGKKRFVRDQPYEFGVPAKNQPTMITPKPVAVEHKTRLPKWEEY